MVSLEKGAMVQLLEQRIVNPRGLLAEIGQLLVNRDVRSFREQRRGKSVWRPRGVPNILGILSDFERGKPSPPKRRFEERPALIDTARLKGSFSWRLVGNDAVEEGTNVKYAALMRRGGVVNHDVTAKESSGLIAWLKSRRSNFLLPEWRATLSAVARATNVIFKIPARLFSTVTRQDLDDIVALIRRKISKPGLRGETQPPPQSGGAP